MKPSITRVRWNEHDEQYMIDNWGRITAEGIARELGRTLNSIYMKAQRLRDDGKIPNMPNDSGHKKTRFVLVNEMNILEFCPGDLDFPTYFEQAIGNVTLAYDIANSYHVVLSEMQDTLSPENFVRRHNELTRICLPSHKSEWLCDVDIMPMPMAKETTYAVCIHRHWFNDTPTGVVLYTYGYNMHLIYVPNDIKK